MHFPPVKNLCPAVSGKSTECVRGGGKADTRPLQKPPVHPLKKGDTGGAWFLSAPNEDNARRAECPPPCNSPASRRGADGSSFASYLLRGAAPNGGLSSRRSRPLRCILALTVPFAWGSFAPFLSGWHLAVFRPLRYPPHGILGHDSIIRLCVLAKPFLSYSIRQEKSTVRPMQNGCVLQDCKKPPQRRGVPLFCRKKRPAGQGEKTAGCSPGKPVRIRQRSKGRALSWKFCTRSTRRWRLWRT